MAGNRINYTLAFTADTSKAKQQLEGLKSQLDGLLNNAALKNVSGMGITKEMQQAGLAASQLKTQLQEATNVNTGKLDLAKFNHSLKTSGMDLAKYKDQLTKLGPEGVKAFNELSLSILNSEVPLIRVSQKLRDFGKTLLSTAKWQISNRMFYGLMSGLSEAFNYAQDLNKSLNDIRIVTGQSADQMAKFADRANKAAKSLSASTLTYTKAALIYYQQGLDDKEVKERTDTTVKMANVTGESASNVSSYMTAIWNNFDNGSKSLEYYSDVITALGAATAASSEEIANGLEKFASIGSTVGLSYEYATAALTTIIDKTRQSEDVVGTALKTIFARIQGLQQGETQDDGVTLNKYSTALANVGVQVLESNGELKKMDTILDELGAKWQTLGNAEKVALAQTVGGVRQYAQLISLMDNWDSFKENVGTARGSEGALQEQADIYAESWEASSNRVKAATEGVFQSIINDDFFIGFNNVLADVIEMIDRLIDSFGGMEGIILALSGLFLNVFQNDMAKALTSFGISVSTILGRNKKDLVDLNEAAKNAFLNSNNLGMSQNTFSTMKEGRDAYLTALENVNAKEKEQLDYLERQLEVAVELAHAAEKKEESAKATVERTKKETQTMTDEEFNAARESYKQRGKVVDVDKDIAKAEKKVEEERQHILLDPWAKKEDDSIDEDYVQERLRERDSYQELQRLKGLKKSGQTGDAFYDKILSGRSREKAQNALGNQIVQNASVQHVKENLFNPAEGGIQKNSATLLGNIESLYKNAGGQEGITAKYGQEFDKEIQELENKLKKIEELKEKIKNLQDGSSEKVNAQKKLEEAQDEAQKALNNLGTGSKTTTEDFVAKGKEMGLVSDELTTAFENQGKAAADADVKIIGAKNALDILKGAAKGAKDSISGFSLGLTQTLSGMASLGSALKSLSSLGDTWDPENDISAFERLTSTMTTLGFALPQLINGFKSLKDGLGAISAATGIAGGWIVALVAAVAALGYAIWYFSTQEERALAKANEDLKEAKDYANKVKQEFDGLKTSIDQLSTAQKTLNSLTKGTKEWRDAALSLNQQVIDLITKFPMLAQYVDNVNGVMTISEEGLQKYLDLITKKAQNAQTSALAKQVAQMEAQQEYDADKKNSLTYTWTTTQGLPQTSGASSQGEDSKTKITTHSKTLSAQEQKQILEDVVKYIDGNNRVKWDEFLKTASSDSKYRDEMFQGFIDSHLDAIKANTQAVEANTAKLDAAKTNFATSYVNNNEDIDDDLKDFYIEGISQRYGDFLGDKQSYVKTMTEDEVLTAIAETMVSDPGDIEIAKAELKAEEGYDLDKLRNQLAQTLAADAAKEGIDSAINSINYQGLNKQQQDIAKSLMSSNFSDEAYKLLNNEDDIKALGSFFNSEQFDNNEFLKAAFGTFDRESVVDKLSTGNTQNLINEGKKYQAEQFDNYQTSIAETYDMDKEAFEKYQETLTNDLPGLDDLIKHHDKQATEITKKTLDWAKNAEELNKVLEENEEALNNKDDAVAYGKAWSAVSKELSELLEMDVDSIFAEKNIEKVKEALEGSRDALIELKEEAAKEMLIKLKPDLDKSGMENAVNSIFGLLENSEVGEIELFDKNNLYQQLIDLAMMMGWGAEEASESFKKMFGIDIPISYKEVKWEDVSMFEHSGLATITNDEGEVISTLDKDNLAMLKEKGSMMVPVFGEATSSGAINPPKTATFSGFSAPKAPSSSSSSSDSGSSPKEKKNLEDEKDRYHTQTKVLESLEKQLDKITKAKDKAFGKSKLDLMDKEISKYKDLVKGQEKYLSKIEEYYAKDKGAVEAIGGIIDSETGQILNYDQLYADAVNRFNNSARSEEDEELYNKTIEKLEKYEETWSLLTDEHQKMQEYLDAIDEAEIEKIQYKLELDLGIADRDIEYLEYLLEKIEDKAFNAAEAIAYLGQQTQSLLNQGAAYKNNIEEILKQQGVSGKDAQAILNGTMGYQDMVNLGLSSAAIEEIINSQQGLMKVNQGLMENEKAIWEQINKTVEDTIEAFNEQGEVISHAGRMLEHYRNIVELVGQENLNITDAMMKAADEANFNNAMANLNNSKNQLAALKEQREQIESRLATQDLTESQRELLKNSLKSINEEIRSAEDQMLSDWENVLEQASTEFDNAVSMTIKAFEKAMSGTFGSFEQLKDTFDKQKELSDLYLDDYKRIYELSKLSRDIEKSLDSTDALAGKQALKELQEEINSLEAQGVELSEYDVQNLRAKYELRLAEIALEEAQNAKNQVRMTRDSEGNWSYTYVADENKMAEAQQNYEDKLLALQQLNSDYIKNLESMILEANTKMVEELKALDKTALGDSYDEEAKRITDFYTNKVSIYESQLSKALGNSSDTYDFWSEYSERTGYGISANADWADSFKETQLSVLTGFQTLEEYHQAFTDAVGSPDEEGTLLGDLSQAYNNWSIRVEDAMELAGTSMENFSSDFDGMVDTVNEGSELAIEDSDKLKDAVVDNMDKMITHLENWRDTHADSVNKMILDNENLVKSINNLLEAYSTLSEKEEEKEKKEIKGDKDSTTDPNGSGVSDDGTETGGKGGGGNPNKNPDLSNDNIEKLKNNPGYEDGRKDGQHRDFHGKKYDEDAKWKDLWYEDAYILGFAEGKKLQKLSYGGKSGSNNSLLPLDSGGYTGEWGPSGKLAVLHEKELVLNKFDTANILEAVSEVRRISDEINNRASLMSLGREYAFTASQLKSGDSGFAQQIIINADFPNATYQDEIVSAFETLRLRASQYANRKNK